MQLNGAAALVTGGASGLGLATVRRLAAQGAQVTILDLPSSAGAELAQELGDSVHFAPADVTVPEEVQAAFELAASTGPLRAVVHCAGRGGTVRVLQNDDSPAEMDMFRTVVDVNLFGTFNILRYGASAMMRSEVVDGERGAFVLTASVAAFEGQIGQLPYAASKAGVVGMTTVAARDLSKRQIRVNTIAPGIFDTPILSRFSDELRASLYAPVPHPKRMGDPDEFAMLAEHILANPMLNSETIRLDGGLRMQPR